MDGPQQSGDTLALRFKNRIWYTLCVLEIGLWSDSVTTAHVLRAVLDPNDILWAWEDEDEAEIQNLIDHTPETGGWWQPKQEEELIRCALDALEARINETQAQVGRGVLGHLDSRTRLRFMTWLLLVISSVASTESAHISVTGLMNRWGLCCVSQVRDDQNQEQCEICHTTQILDCWLETMLLLYTVNDLEAMQGWTRCHCFSKKLKELPSQPHDSTEKQSEHSFLAHRLMFGIFVPVWPSILWMLFRMTALDQADPLPTFLSLLHGTNHNLFTWDSTDLTWIRARKTLNASFIQKWYECVTEIRGRTWTDIAKITKVNGQRHHWTSEDWGDQDNSLRLHTFSLLVSDKLQIPDSLKEVFDPGLSSPPWAQFSLWDSAIQSEYRPQGLYESRVPSQDFWTEESLGQWLLGQTLNLCHDVWEAPCEEGTAVERVYWMYYILKYWQKFLPLCGFHLVVCVVPWHIHQSSWHPKNYLHQHVLASCMQYRAHFESLIKFLKANVQLFEPTQKNPYYLHNHITRCLFLQGVHMVRFLMDDNNYQELLKTRGTNAQALLDMLQDFLDLESTLHVRPMLFKAMSNLARASGLYPQCFALLHLTINGGQVGGGAYSDIWKGELDGKGVCMKIMRIFETADMQVAFNEFGSEALIWRQLSHPNLLPFLGVYHHHNRLCLISPWMDNGNILTFIRRDSPDTDKRLSLILDVALGLQYLHAHGTIHGDLKGLNILVTPSHRACIADFGLSSLASAVTSRLAASSIQNHRGTPRYYAPELYERNGRNSFASDIYAFACVCYEILTGQLPFWELSNDVQIMFAVHKGERPILTPECTGTAALDSLWTILQECWDTDASNRPTISDIIIKLTSAPINAVTTSSTADWEDKITARFRRSSTLGHTLPSVSQIDHMMFGNRLVT
ncbi:kinase domain-containing protein [Favolaschia claudopus]|uniref:Kinase domain-containing protein n=1 Tax=Favolaschia claudopus TaxID=2862362 RepID=A0AAW0ED14_9AGAR